LKIFLVRKYIGFQGKIGLIEDLKSRIEMLVGWMAESKYLIVFTGAGISTDSGIPDFRGPQGVWTLKAKGLPVNKVDYSQARPNINHLAIYELQSLNKLKFLISQNVDNLHLKSGIRSEILAELHGNITRVRCSQCEFTMDNLGDDMSCPQCGGKMNSSVVDFGQSLPRRDLDLAISHSQNCDLFIVVGSSLVVNPAADLPRVAVDSGAKLVIINRGETPLDRFCSLRFSETIGEVLPVAVDRLKGIMKHVERI
jgi:NAD-dependent deacetylase